VTATARWRRNPPRWAVALLAVALVGELAVAGSAAVVHGLRDHQAASQARSAEPRPLSSGLSSGSESRLTPRERSTWGKAIKAVLDARAHAVLAHDRTGFLAGLDPQSTDFRNQQATVFDNLAAVPFASWSYELDPQHETAMPVQQLARYAGSATWMPDVELDYALTGFDTAPTPVREYFTFVHRDQHWYLASDTDADALKLHTGRLPWDSGPVTVKHGSHSLVLGHPQSGSLMTKLVTLADDAVPAVTKVWGTDWSQKVVVVVPATADELGRILDDTTDMSQIAAVTTAELPSDAPPVGARVIVNPATFDHLPQLGKRVVIRHEITHVASRALTTKGTPTWLAEGFADYVGYLDSGVSVRSAARELGNDLRGGAPVGDLPTNDDFGATNGKLAQAYEKAWMACRFIVDKAGQAGLVRFYRTVGTASGEPDAAVSAGLRTVLNMTTEQFTADWRNYVEQQLS
jgi:hypothetical protein